MQGGFEFDGVDIDLLGLKYVPDTKTMYPYKPTSATLEEQKFNAHDGGFLYGSTRQPKDFTLRVAFEDNRIDDGLLYNVYRVFQVGKSGRLVFKRRPWIWYYATITQINPDQILTPYSGLLTITARAYYPFGRSDAKCIDDLSIHSERLMANSGMLMIDPTHVTQTIDNSHLLTSAGTYWYLYNPGSENAHVAVEIAGDTTVKGVTIRNLTTDKEMKVRGLTKAVTTNAGKYLVVDGLNGKTVLTNGSTATQSFLYHDHGFLELVPGHPQRNIMLTVKSSTRIESSTLFEFDSSMVNKWLVDDNGYTAMITAVPESGYATVQFFGRVPDANYGGNFSLVTMNRIAIEGSGFSLSKVNFVYKPTFS